MKNGQMASSMRICKCVEKGVVPPVQCKAV